MSREESFNQIHQNFKNLEKQDKDDVNNLQLFMIIPDRVDRQLLQINLIPGGIAYFRGEKIYSNTAQLKVTQQTGFWSRIIKRDIFLSMAVNDTPGLQILGIKHPVHLGQILILDLSVYKQSFYFSTNHLLASKKVLPNLQSSHPQLIQLRLVQHKNKMENIFDALDVNQDTIVLQACNFGSKIESPIMQKYLGEDEEFYLFNRFALLAASKDVKMQLVRQGDELGIKAKGKGWVFYETSKTKAKFFAKNNSLMVFVFIMVFMTIFELIVAILL